jgi:hypothetical protein
MTKAHAFLLLGGLEGIDGYVDSAGMEQLIPMLSAIGVPTTTHTWTTYTEELPEMRALPADVLRIVIGYSGGGSRATWLANTLPMPRIDLMVLYDPSPTWQMRLVGNNVVRALVYHNKNPMMPSFYGWLGGGVLTPRAFSRTQIETIDISEQHLAVQFNGDLHKRTIAAVQTLLAAPAKAA